MSNTDISLSKFAGDKSMTSVEKRPSFWIDPHLIQIEPGFNLRTPSQAVREHIDGIKSGIKSGATIPPVWVRTEGETVFLVDGHCRLTAYFECIKEGMAIKKIAAEEFTGNEIQRQLLMLTTAQGLPLTPLSRGMGYRNLLSWGWSVKEIADYVGHSMTAVENALKLADMPPEMQEMVINDEVKSSTVLQAMREHGSKAGEVLKKSISDAKSKGKRVTPKAIKDPKFPARHAERVFKHVEHIFGCLDAKAKEHLTELENRPEEELKDEYVQIPASEFLKLLKSYGDGIAELDKRKKSSKPKAAPVKARQSSEDLLMPI